MIRRSSTSRIRAVNEQILDETDRRIRRETIVAEREQRFGAQWQSDPRKCPFYAVGPDLVPVPLVPRRA